MSDAHPVQGLRHGGIFASVSVKMLSVTWPQTSNFRAICGLPDRSDAGETLRALSTSEKSPKTR
jgi:hypothetical protein